MSTSDPPADAAALLASVEGLVVNIVFENCDRASDRPDLMQECRLALWKAIPKFDPARTPWPGYAAAVIRGCVRAKMSDQAERYNRLRPVELFEEVTNARDDDPAELVADQEEADEAGDGTPLGEFRRAMRAVGWATVLAALTPKLRRLVELIAVDGLTIGAAADQLGFPMKAVRRNLQVAVGRLATAGHVPQELAHKFGLEVGALIRRGQTAKQGSAADRKARQELVAEAGGLSTRKLADLLGCSQASVVADRRKMREAAGLAG